jgi:hypothetical protein
MARSGLDKIWLGVDDYTRDDWQWTSHEMAGRRPDMGLLAVE